MRLFGKDLDTEVALVAEIGVNHEGSLETAFALLAAAKDAGADAVKFQTYTPARFASASDPARLARVTGFDLGVNGLRALAAEARRLGIALFSSAITEDVIPFLAEFEAIKIASGDIDFEPAIRAAARSGKPVLLSTGLATLAEVETAVGWARDEVGAARLRDRLILMQCVSAYPTPVEQAGVRAIPFLAERTGLRVGYSNHVTGPEACLAAVALGACLVEVHFTDRKEGRAFRDHALSCDPADLRALAAAIGAVKASLGAAAKDRQPCELPNLKAIRKGVVAARDLPKGTVLTRQDLMFARPATEFRAAEIGHVVGRRLLRGLKAGELVPRDGLAED